jgi:hypothetical protein
MAANLRSIRVTALLALFACTDDGSGRSATFDASATATPDANVPGILPPGTNAARTCRQFSPARAPFFGDLHIHTALSLDANLQGTRVRPADAYRFARGERIALPPYDAAGNAARSAQLERPLDFAAVSDHAEFLGLVTTCLTPGAPGYDSMACTQYRNEPGNAFIPLNASLAAPRDSARLPAPCDASNAYCGSAARSAWMETREAADRAQDGSEDCTFTSFAAYEWSASPGTQNLHRNVIFHGARVPELPFSYFDGNREEQLWDALERDCLGAPGCDVVTIPHNSNLSAGLMFEPLDQKGQPIDSRYAERRARFEPLVEIFQHKGSSECLPEMGPDELCSFENIPFNTLGTALFGGNATPGSESRDMLVPRDYVRDALGQGLLLARKLGVNPFAYGLVASTDTHVGTAGAVSERGFTGHGGAGRSASALLAPSLVDSAFFNPGGLAVLWAEENSRDALFRAMKRREAYGTSGPRLTLRFFGGFGLGADLCTAPDFAERGYAQGVPMGGELAADASGRAPTFALYALRDPGTASAPGAPIERLQIIKGWLVGDEVRYAVHDVTRGPEGVGADPDSCELRGQGSDELCGTWRDPAFDPAVPAFYYARVLEAPSCRWHSYACNAAGVRCSDPATVRPGFEGCCGTLPRVQQERAWSSPVFYRPR